MKSSTWLAFIARCFWRAGLGRYFPYHRFLSQNGFWWYLLKWGHVCLLLQNFSRRPVADVLSAETEDQ